MRRVVELSGSGVEALSDELLKASRGHRIRLDIIKNCLENKRPGVLEGVFHLKTHQIIA